MKARTKGSGNKAGKAAAKPCAPHDAPRPNASPKEIRLSELGLAAAALAHELRQPLSAIQNLAAYAKSAVSGDNRRLQETLDLLEQQALLAGRILTDLACFAQSGTAASQAIRVPALVDAVLNRVPLPADTRIKRRFPATTGLALADPVHVECILTNLILNGVESMNGGGTLRISSRNERSYVIVQVTDTGCGIDPAHAPDIFTAFYTTKRTGTGLGLALCRELAEANGGSITFDTCVGKGTTFQLRLPRTAAS
jgi:two-component system, LuxR family, sensor kinase FixL